jgi:membrane protein DedA with SNARE-associated domain
MIEKLLLGSASAIVFVISHLSYAGIVLLMTIESCNIPMPSEVILPAAGFLAYQGQMNIFLAALAGAIGCIIGSLVSYAIGYYAGRPILEKYGKYILLTKDDLDLGQRMFAKYGNAIAFFSRLLPIIRTFISIPAGIEKMDLKRFVAYSFAGSFLWSLLLVFVGYKIGDHQQILMSFFHKFNILIAVVIVLALAYYIYTHVKKLRAQ